MKVNRADEALCVIRSNHIFKTLTMRIDVYYISIISDHIIDVKLIAAEDMMGVDL